MDYVLREVEEGSLGEVEGGGEDGGLSDMQR